MSEYAVAMYVMGGFSEWVTDPGPLEEAQEFIANPPEWHALRPQDHFVIFELRRVEEAE